MLEKYPVIAAVAVLLGEAVGNSSWLSVTVAGVDCSVSELECLSLLCF